ncbi:MAG TPA: ABC transporter ATP-binding protein [Planctomycetota bacterium]|nr:ABC transporter ATP-binding protein [Planctomycetota bacterium]
MNGGAAPLLALEGVTKSFRRGDEEVVALAGVDLSVARGELLLIMGPSGSGKSTLLHLLGGLERPTRGRVVFRAKAEGAASAASDGEDLARLDDEALARLRRTAIGFVFQEFHLLPTLSAEENAMLPLLLDGAATAAAHGRARAMLERVGLSARRDHLPDQLSGGERQRVAIARALVADPPLLLCDEPTGSLDSARGREIFALLRELADREGRAVVVVTHDPAALPFATRVVELRDGRIVREPARP